MLEFFLVVFIVLVSAAVVIAIVVASRYAWRRIGALIEREEPTWRGR